MKKIIFTLAFVLLIFSSGFAQKNYVWESYKIQITVPNDFRVKKNTNTDFDMKGDGMELAMTIFEKNVAIDDLDDAALDGAKAMKLEEIDLAQKVSVNELQGYYVEGFKGGNRVMFACLGDPNSQTNFFIVITFADGDKVAEKDALAIINSLDVI